MLKRIALNLLLTFFISTVVTMVVLWAAFYYYPEFGVYIDFGISYILNWVLYCNIIFLILSVPAMFIPLPGIKRNVALRLVLYFGGSIAVVLFLLTRTDWIDPENIVIGWLPFVVFMFVHTFYYIVLEKKRMAITPQKSPQVTL